MDRLELRIRPAGFPTGATRELVPFVNGTSLMDLQVAVRRTKAGPRRGASGTTRLGDGHAGLPLFDGPPDVTPLRPGDEPREVAVLGCGCGVVDCSPVHATIARDQGVVTWEVHGHTFRFDAAQYEVALAEAS